MTNAQPPRRTYRRRFPQTLSVLIEPVAEGGFVASVRELPGCVTQADSHWELVEMVNDAVRTWLEIPRRSAERLPFYVPPAPFIEDPIAPEGEQVRLFSRLVDA